MVMMYTMYTRHKYLHTVHSIRCEFKGGVRSELCYKYYACMQQFMCMRMYVRMYSAGMYECIRACVYDQICIKLAA